MMKYLYKCDECGVEREVTHGMSEEPVIRCQAQVPGPHSAEVFCEFKMRKKITAPRTLFRGEWDTIDISKTHE